MDSIENCKRYLAAFRAAIRYRNPETGRRHFCHLKEYRKAYLKRILELRRVLLANK